MAVAARTIEALVERTAALSPLIRRHAGDGEQERRLAPAVVDAFHEANLFRVLLPERFAGAELDVVEAMAVFEEAAADGSAGWNLAIGAGSLRFALMLDDEDAIEHVVKTPHALAAGSINPFALRIHPEPGGYRLRGRLQYASGVLQSNWIMAGGLLWDGDKPRLLPDGMPAIRGAFFPTREARVLDTWRVSGLAGTGSHDVDVEDVFVPASLTFEFLATAPKRHEPLSAISLPSRLSPALVAVGVGILRRALEELTLLAGSKTPFGSRSLLRDRAHVQIDTARAMGLLDGARAHVQSVCRELFERVRAGASPAVPDLARLRLAYVTATEQLLRGIELVRHAAGMNALQSGSPIERCWRDLNAVGQHFALGTAHLERIGKIRFGLDPGPGPI